MTELTPEQQIKLAIFREQEQQLVDHVWERSAHFKEEEREVYARKLRQSILHGDAPKTRSELWNCIKALFGREIPYVVTEEPTDEHPWCSPFDWYWNVWIGAWDVSLVYAPRESGKTMGMGDLAYLLCSYKDAFEMMHAAGTKSQADVVQKYLLGFSEDQVLNSAFKKGLVTKLTAKWNNNSSWTIKTGTFKGVSGAHPSALSCDEIQVWDTIASINQTFKVPSRRNDEVPRWIGGSTNQVAFGPMNYLLDTAKEKQIHVAKWSVFEIMQPCKTCRAIDQEPYGTDAARSKVCPLWEYCHGKRGTKSRGWKPLDDVIKDVIRLGGPTTSEVKTQILCLKPSSKGTVLNNFEYSPKSLGGNFTNITYDYNGELPFYISFDPAEGQKSVMWFWHYFNEQSFMFDQIIIEDCPDTTAAKVALYRYCKEKNYKDPQAIIVDPRKTDSVYQLRIGTPEGEDINHFYNAVTPNIEETQGGQAIRDGLTETRMEICNGTGVRKLFINPETCPGAIMACKNHHYPTDSMGENTTSVNPAPEFKDEIDAIRYWVRYKRTNLDKQGFRIMLG